MLTSLIPFIVLLIVGVIISLIPMDELIRKVCYLVIGVVALLMLLKFLNV